MKNKVALIILDGYGEGGASIEPQGNNAPCSKASTGVNAIAEARTPTMDRLYETCPHTLISASGKDVGLPAGQMGNSEVGHLNIGAGRIVYQDLTMISKAIEEQEDDFYKNPALLGAMRDVTAPGEHALHLMGLVSDGGVHSHMDHLKALLSLAKEQGVNQTYVHAFMDGRDTSPTAGMEYIRQLREYMTQIAYGTLATISGRYYAMDRDKRWERIEKAYRVLTTPQNENTYDSGAMAYLKDSYEAGITDEFIVPQVLNPTFKGIQSGDSVIFFNFRPDRARQLSHAFLDEEFPYFKREKLNVKFVGFTKYDVTLKGIETAFPEKSIKNTLGEVVSHQGLKQLRIAETEKYAHVTFFFNGGVEKPNPGEERILINSPKVATYDLKPEMSAYELTDQFIEQVKADQYHMIICNYANSDMVGHTGVFPAAVKAIEALDTCLGKLVPVLKAGGYSFIITADHGNSECMVDVNGDPMTSHTSNLVPLILYDANHPEQSHLRSKGSLRDIAPTMLQLLGLEQPEEMTGRSLLHD